MGNFIAERRREKGAKNRFRQVADIKSNVNKIKTLGNSIEDKYLRFTLNLILNEVNEFDFGNEAFLNTELKETKDNFYFITTPQAETTAMLKQQSDIKLYKKHSSLQMLYLDTINLTEKYSKFNCNKLICSIVCSTCFQCEQQYQFIKYIFDCKKYLNIKLHIDDIYICSVELQTSIDVAWLITQTYIEQIKLDLNLSYQKMNLINKLYTPFFYTFPDGCDRGLKELYTKPSLTVLDSFIREYLRFYNKPILRDIHLKSSYSRRMSVFTKFLDYLILNGFKLNYVNYGLQVPDGLKKGIMFLLRHNVRDLLVRPDKSLQFDLVINKYFQTQLMSLLAQQHPTVGELKTRMAVYYSIKSSVYNFWNAETTTYINELIQSLTILPNGDDNNEPIEDRCNKINPLKLTELCRIKARDSYKNYAICRLNLPKSVIKFLSYENDNDFYDNFI